MQVHVLCTISYLTRLLIIIIMTLYDTSYTYFEGVPSSKRSSCNNDGRLRRSLPRLRLGTRANVSPSTADITSHTWNKLCSWQNAATYMAPDAYKAAHASDCGAEFRVDVSACSKSGKLINPPI